MNLLQQIGFNTKPGPFHENAVPVDTLPAQKLVRLIAFYLPQFHSIAENDLWWGKGFTEWTNVTKAIPRFEGHYQPHLPADLGFYDLRSSDALRRQAELAAHYGIFGFCFHYYWFNGKRLLGTPLENLLAAPDIDLPFFINWANENWSRRWDGQEKNLLMAQQHSPEDDINFAAAMVPLFRDPRYIRINGRPLLMLYRPGVLPDAAATVKRWRHYFQDAGVGDPYIIMPQAFGDDDPRKYGMDAAVGFPPHAAVGPPPDDNAGWGGASVRDTLELFDEDYSGYVARYDDLAERALSNNPAEFRLFPGVCPGWDNEARKPNKGACFIGSTPEKYGRWLDGACRNAVEAEQPDERIVFINAWNEWAEGAHLEPDRHFGHAYLAETARALSRVALPNAGTSSRRATATRVSPAVQTPRRPLKVSLRRLAKRVAFKAADMAEATANLLRS